MTAVDGTGVATICDLFDRTVRRYPDQQALRTLDGSSSYTYTQYRSAVADIASVLAAQGVRRHDVVVLMFENRPIFHVVDAAVMHLGAATCSIYNTSPARDIAHVVQTSGARVSLCESSFVSRLSEAAPGLRIICTDSDTADADSLDDLPRATDFDFDAIRKAVEPDDVLTLIYTSGTTGMPKPVELTHRSMLAEITLTAEVLEFRAGDRVPSVLPMAHAAQRWGTHYSGMAFGMDVICIDDMSTLGAGLVEIQPDIWGTVPRILEKMVLAVQTKLGAEPDPQKRAFIDYALETGQRYAAARETARFGGADIPEALAAERAQVDSVLAEIRRAMGLGQARWIMVGAAPTAPHIHEFLDGLGLEIVEVWGMSELSSVATINGVGRQKSGTVGTALREVEVSIADDGEILVRGPILMRGYRGLPEATAEAISADGWLRTGDLGSLDADGYLSITGRKKEIIVNSAGKNISPAKIESTVKAESPLVGSVMAVGDSRPYLTALVVLDPDALAAFAAQHGLQAGTPEEQAQSEAVLQNVAEAVERANAQLSRVEQIKYHRVLAEFWLPGGDELTPTLKLKRRVIEDRYRTAIDELYTSAAVAR